MSSSKRQREVDNDAMPPILLRKQTVVDEEAVSAVNRPITRVVDALRLVKDFEINLNSNSMRNEYNEKTELIQYKKRKREIIHKQYPVKYMINKILHKPYSPIKIVDGTYRLSFFAEIVSNIEKTTHEMLRFVRRKYNIKIPILSIDASPEEIEYRNEKIKLRNSMLYDTLSKDGLYPHIQRELDRFAGVPTKIPDPVTKAEINDTIEVLRVLESKSACLKALTELFENFVQLSKNACEYLIQNVDSYGLFVLLEGESSGILIWSPCDAHKLKLEEAVSSYIEWPLSMHNPCFMGIRALEVISVDEALSTHRGKTYIELCMHRANIYLNRADRAEYAEMLKQKPMYKLLLNNKMGTNRAHRVGLKPHAIIEDKREGKSEKEKTKEERKIKPSVKLDNTVTQYTMFDGEDEVGICYLALKCGTERYKGTEEEEEDEEDEDEDEDEEDGPSVARGTVGI